MNEAEKLQNILRDLQATRQQLISTSSQIREFEVTLEALKEQEEGKKIYRQIGALLFEVDDRKEMVEQLESSIKTLKEHYDLLEKQDIDLKSIYEKMVDEIENTN